MLKHYEKILLLRTENFSITDYNEFINLLAAGEYYSILDSFFDIIRKKTELMNEFCSHRNPSAFIESFISYISRINNWYNHCDALSIGIASLYYFLQINVTGPSQNSDKCSLKNLLKYEKLIENNILEEVNKNIIKYLNTNDEIISANIKQPILLLLAESVFKSQRCKSNLWWLMRSLYVRQLFLSDLSQEIYYELVYVYESLLEIMSSNDEEVKITFYLEIIQIYLHYGEVTKAEKFMNDVFNYLCLQADLLGALGKRTRFQQYDIAQLILKVNLEDGTSFSENVIRSSLSNLPKDQRLEDDIRLPEIKLADVALNEQPQINVLQQAAILALFVLKKKMKPKDSLQYEELSPYLSFLLSQPKVWCFQLMLLFFRSCLEAESSRTIERSIVQLQSLISDLESSNPFVVNRIPFIFCSFIVPKYTLEANLAKLQVKVGAIQSALEIFLRLNMWEEIVVCYNILQQRHKAAEIIRNEMSKQETVYLWCLLGDATDDVACYEKAWLLSKKKSSRAQRHWGIYYFNRKQYEESIPHFEKSLDLNSLQIEIWFKLGYATLVKEEWELSTKAYKRYCSLEPENFEAWNNLAKAYVKLGCKDRAYIALQEAIKYNYENWKIWDNFMVVSIDCGRLINAVNCYHRILDLKFIHEDSEILRILVEAVKNEEIKNNVQELKSCVLQLFGRISSKGIRNADIWRWYARLTKTSDEDNIIKYEKVVQYLKKARAKVSHYLDDWLIYPDSCKDVVNLTLELVDAYIEYSSYCDSSLALSNLNSARLLVQAMIVNIKSEYEHNGIVEESMATTLSEIEDKLREIQALIISKENNVN